MTTGVSPSQAVEHALALLPRNPALAERQAREILKILPHDARALFVVAAARRRQGDPATARALLERLTQADQHSALAHQELGLTLAGLGESEAALAALRRAVSLQRDLPRAWLSLSDHFVLAGDVAAAAEARAEHMRSETKSPNLLAAADAVRHGRWQDAVPYLKRHLLTAPDDATALRMLGDVAARLGHREDAEEFLAHCLAAAPQDDAARLIYATILLDQHKPDAALAQLEQLLVAAPSEPKLLYLAATCRILLGEFAAASAILNQLLDLVPEQPTAWLGRGQVRRMMGQADDAVADFRHALSLRPGMGEAWWYIADLKTGRLSEADIAAMRFQAGNTALNTANRVHLHYALGKAWEDRQDWQSSFADYARGASLHRSIAPYDADAHTASVKLAIAEWSTAFFAQRTDGGELCDAPIFIVGLPRAGSTLLEQILGRHADIEPTAELPAIVHMVSALGRPGRKGTGPGYSVALSRLNGAERQALGREYLRRTARYRRTEKRHFVDKMPANFLHAGFIRLILPRARIIDIRRHPMAACFATFKQHFGQGHEFSYGLADAGRYYRDYVALMAHMDRVLPGLVHRVIYEDLVDDPEREIRRILTFLQLPFDAACLRHWEGAGPIVTHSSEQVRQPIYQSATALWRRYEPWLGELKAALGDIEQTWRD